MLARLIDAHPDFRPRAWMDELPPLDAFGTLIFQVVGPAAVGQRDPDDRLASAGAISAAICRRRPSCWQPIRRCCATAASRLARAQTLRALAERFVDGRLSDEALARMTDEEVEATLTEVPGIGPWSAHGFLLVALDRPDVFLSGDLALRRAIQRAYGFDHLPTEDEMAEVSDRWRPYRSLAVSYLFASEYEESDVTDSVGNHRRRSARPGDGAHRAARRPLGRDRQQPRPGIADVGGLGPRRGSLGRHGGRRGSGRDRRHRRAVGPRARRRQRTQLGAAQVVIDATNDWAADDLDGRTSSEIVADLVAGARVVKAANTLGAEVLGSDPARPAVSA